MKRVFVGLKSSEITQRLVQTWQRDKQDWPVRWLKPKNLHLTLVPPFYSDDIEKIKTKLVKVKLPAKDIFLRYKVISFGPDPHLPRLIWAVGNPIPELEKVKSEMERILELKPEPRAFLPHLTLARFRTQDFSRFRIKSLEERIEWAEKIESFQLFESALCSAGAEYKVLQSFSR